MTLKLVYQGDAGNELFSNLFAGNLVAHMGAGNDSVTGGLLADVVFGDGGLDILSGQDGADTIHGGAGDDWIRGGDGNDKLFGDAGIDFINGEKGDDTMDGGAGRDVLFGGDGSDHVSGGLGNDLLFGGSQPGFALTPPVIFLGFNGQAGIPISNLPLNGIPGQSATTDPSRDFLDGGAGNDKLDGLFGRDILTGGAGADQFRFSTAPGPGNFDRITDFAPGVDKIALGKNLFGALGETVTAAEFHLGAAARDANDHLIYNQATGVLLFDADGKGGLAAVKIEVLSNHAHISSQDFIMV